MSRIAVGLLILLAGCGVQQNTTGGRSSQRLTEEAAAERAYPECYEGFTLEQTEAWINIIQEAKRAGLSRTDAWYSTTLPADPASPLYSGFLNCIDAILDEVYGPG